MFCFSDLRVWVEAYQTNWGSMWCSPMITQSSRKISKGCGKLVAVLRVHILIWLGNQNLRKRTPSGWNSIGKWCLIWRPCYIIFLFKGYVSLLVRLIAISHIRLFCCTDFCLKPWRCHPWIWSPSQKATLWFTLKGHNMPWISSTLLGCLRTSSSTRARTFFEWRQELLRLYLALHPMAPSSPWGRSGFWQAWFVQCMLSNGLHPAGKPSDLTTFRPQRLVSCFLFGV